MTFNIQEIKDWLANPVCHKDSWRDIYHEFLPICGCGSSDEIIDMFDECLRFAALKEKPKYTEDPSAPWGRGFYRSLAHEICAHILDHEELIEHGGGIGWAWATDEGKELLAIVDKFKQEHPEVEED